MARKKTRLLVRVVYAGDQDVFERQPLFFARRIVVASRKQSLDVVTTIDRHNLVAHFICRSMQRNSEADLQGFFGKLFNLRGETTGRNGDVPGADAETPWRVDDLNRTHHVLQVCQRFAHAHENDVVDLLAAFALDRDDLIDNFIWPEVAGESFKAAGAKFAAVSAADLGRNADCSA